MFCIMDKGFLIGEWILKLQKAINGWEVVFWRGIWEDSCEIKKEKEVKGRGKGIARQRSCVHMVIWIAMHSAKN